MSTNTLIDLDKFPTDAITIFGLSFHAKNISDLIVKRQGHENTEVFKGTLGEYEAYQHIKKLNDTSPHPGLELLVKGYEIANNEMKEENDESEKFLWREFVEITGLHPNSVDSVLKLLIAEYIPGSNIREMFNKYTVEKKADVSAALDGFMKTNFEHVENSERKPNELLAAENFLYGAAQSFLQKREYEIDRSRNASWDYRFVTCDKLIKDNSMSYIPLCNPKALSRPHAEAMYEVRKLLFSITFPCLDLPRSQIFFSKLL